MKYFICALNEIRLGFPAEFTERIITVSRMHTHITESEEQETFVSIPLLFRQSAGSPHGLVLRSDRVNRYLQGKIILVMPKIETDLEIPDEKVHALPAGFSGIYSFIKGICFADRNMVLIIDPILLLDMLYG